MLVLGIETSCDETAVALVKKNTSKFGGKIIKEIVLSQAKKHEIFGGVVPEISSREHILSLKKITQTILKQSNIKVSNIDAFAATCGPGLNGGLLIGSNFAKSLSIGLNKPFFAINHLQAHILVSRVKKKIEFPFLVLLISGGHTQLIIAKDYNKFEIIGETIDDAVGEAFDKTAKILGLGYPGGPKIEMLAKKSERQNIVLLPRPMIKKKNLDFSFSGLKTAATNFLNNLDPNEKLTKADFAASYQEAIVDSLLSNFVKAVNETGVKNISGGGGVMANSRLREKMNIFAENNDLNIYLPTPKLSTDNAAMICVAAQNNLITNDINADDVRLSSIIT